MPVISLFLNIRISLIFLPQNIPWSLQRLIGTCTHVPLPSISSSFHHWFKIGNPESWPLESIDTFSPAVADLAMARFRQLSSYGSHTEAAGAPPTKAGGLLQRTACAFLCLHPCCEAPTNVTATIHPLVINGRAISIWDGMHKTNSLVVDSRSLDMEMVWMHNHEERKREWRGSPLPGHLCLFFAFRRYFYGKGFAKERRHQISSELSH